MKKYKSIEEFMEEVKRTCKEESTKRIGEIVNEVVEGYLGKEMEIYSRTPTRKQSIIKNHINSIYPEGFFGEKIRKDSEMSEEQANYDAGKVVRKPSQMSKGLDGMEIQIKGLGRLVEELSIKLSDVSTAPDPETAGDAVDNSSDSSYVRRIKDATGELMDQNRKINDLLSRLQI